MCFFFWGLMFAFQKAIRRKTWRSRAGSTGTSSWKRRKGLNRKWFRRSRSSRTTSGRIARPPGRTSRGGRRRRRRSRGSAAGWRANRIRFCPTTPHCFRAWIAPRRAARNWRRCSPAASSRAKRTRCPIRPWCRRPGGPATRTGRPNIRPPTKVHLVGNCGRVAVFGCCDLPQSPSFGNAWTLVFEWRPRHGIPRPRLVFFTTSFIRPSHQCRNW